MNSQLQRAFSPASLGSLELKNRVIKAATFEGLTPNGVPGDALTRFHRRLAEGGVAMTTISYCTTEPDGRISEEMMYLHEGIAPQIRTLIAEIKASGARVSGQMTHCGNFSKNRKLQRLERPLGPSRQFNMLGAPVGLPFAGAMSTADIDHLVQTYGDTARLMKELGFEATEIIFGHGYGLSQFISPKTNRRTDEYGGSFENRMRLPLRVLAAVREAVGDDFPILGKISLGDGAKGGISVDESLRVGKSLDEAGIDALITSGGSSSFNPMMLFRGDSIVDGMVEQEQNPIAKLGLKLVSKALFKQYPYDELFFLEEARRLRDTVQCSIAYVGGCTTLQSLETLMSEGFDFVQLGRALIKDPEFVHNAMSNPDYVNGCTHCNRCVALIEDPGGTRCPLNEVS
jgi:2,4-dienoyl-CoA reductase-like NADH-dependent reductase (Old Yellow Enzyme family)